MKNRKLTYILLPAVLVVWGLIGYKLITHFEGNANEATTGQDRTPELSGTDAPDTFSLLLSYRDPFLDLTANTQTDLGTSVNDAPVPGFTQVADAREPVVWPSLAYYGIIRNKRSGSITTLVRINGREQLLSENQESEGVRLLKAFPDSGIFRFNNESKTILK